MTENSFKPQEGMVLFMQYKDYYKILGVEKSAAQDQIKKTYRKLAKKYHPDANANNKDAEEKFKEINEAYEVLGDPEKRKKYDAIGQNADFRNGTDFDPSQFGFGGPGGNVRYEYRTASDGDFSDFFNMFFGGGGIHMDDLFGGGRASGARAPRSAKGGDIEAEIEITPEEGFAGAQKKIVLRSRSGEKNITFTVPKGVRDGEKIRLAGQGEPGAGGGGQGDLYMTAHLVPGRFVPDGMNLSMTADVYPWEAALGAELPVGTPDGKIRVKIPAGITAGGKIRVKGRGYIDRAGSRGDLFIKIRIVNPPQLSAELITAYESLSKKYSR